jgi:hypothetical protein
MQTHAIPHTSLFAGLLGADAFEALPSPLRRLHLRTGTARWHGEVEVVRGRSLLARLCGWATRLPPAGTGPIEVEIIVDDGIVGDRLAGDRREQWTRHIAGHAMRSRLRAVDGLLDERLGLVDFRFRLTSVDHDIVWTVAGVRVFGLLPLPAAWFSQVRARESAEGERYRFEVTAALPLAGPLVHYRGWLEVP